MWFYWVCAVRRWRRSGNYGDIWGAEVDLGWYHVCPAPSPGDWRQQAPVMGHYPHHYPPQDLKVWLVKIRMTEPLRFNRITTYWE